MHLTNEVEEHLKKILEIKTISPFRSFAQNLWEEHKEEIMNWEGTTCAYTSQEYFNKNKWYVKKLYKSTLSIRG